MVSAAVLKKVNKGFNPLKIQMGDQKTKNTYLVCICFTKSLYVIKRRGLIGPKSNK